MKEKKKKNLYSAHYKIEKKIIALHHNNFDLCDRQKVKGEENRQQIYNYTTVSWKYTLEEL